MSVRGSTDQKNKAWIVVLSHALDQFSYQQKKEKENVALSLTLLHWYVCHLRYPIIYYIKNPVCSEFNCIYLLYLKSFVCFNITSSLTSNPISPQTPQTAPVKVTSSMTNNSTGWLSCRLPSVSPPSPN